MLEFYREASGFDVRKNAKLLRGSEGRQMEDGFGVAVMNPKDGIRTDGTACYSGEYLIRYLVRLLSQGNSEQKW